MSEDATEAVVEIEPTEPVDLGPCMTPGCPNPAVSAWGGGDEDTERMHFCVNCMYPYIRGLATGISHGIVVDNEMEDWLVRSVTINVMFALYIIVLLIGLYLK